MKLKQLFVLAIASLGYLSAAILLAWQAGEITPSHGFAGFIVGVIAVACLVPGFGFAYTMLFKALAP